MRPRAELGPAAESAREAAKQLESKERRMADAVRTAAERVLRRGVKEVPAWLVKGVFLTRLFALETAVAKESEDKPVFGVEAKGDRTKPAFSEEAKGSLLTFLQSEDAEITVQPVGGSSEIFTYTITAEEIAKGHPFSFDFPIQQIQFSRKITTEQFDATPEVGWTSAQQVESGKSRLLSAELNLPGSYLYVSRRVDGETGEGREAFGVSSDVPTTEQGRAPSTAVHADWSSVGLANLDGVFYQRGEESVGEIAGLPVYTKSEDRREIRRELRGVDQIVERGIQNVEAQFGLTEGGVTGIRIDESRDKNAFAFGTQISLFDEMIDKSVWKKLAEGQELPLSKQALEEVVEHETLHVMDQLFNLSSSEDFSTIATVSSREMLDAYNESSFMGVFGGHASENPHELFASVMNGLDDPEWEAHMADMGELQREHYALTLAAIRSSIEAADGIPEDAPIRALLDERIDAINATLAAE